MSGLEKIIDDILSEARSEAEQSVAEAEKKAEQTVQDAVHAAKAKALETVGTEQLKVRAMREHALSSCQLEERKKLLKAKHEMIDEVLCKLTERVKNLDRDAYVGLLARLAKSSLSGGQLVFSARDKALQNDVCARLGEGYSVGEGVAEKLQSGFVLVNGKVTAECSVEAFIDSMRRELEPIIADALFATEN